jgi:hypothetical protein
LEFQADRVHTGDRIECDHCCDLYINHLNVCLFTNSEPSIGQVLWSDTLYYSPISHAIATGLNVSCLLPTLIYLCTRIVFHGETNVTPYD